MTGLTRGLVLALLAAAAATAGCERADTPAERALDGAKDALDLREHEKLRDAGEDAADALKNAAEGAKEEVTR